MIEKNNSLRPIKEMAYLGIVSATRLSGLLAPGAFDILTVEVCVVDRDDGLRGRLFRRESGRGNKREKHSSKCGGGTENCRPLARLRPSPDKGVSLVLEDPDLLDLTVGSENLLQGLLGRSLCQIAAVDGAVGGG